MGSIQALIVDDSPSSRAGLRALLSTCPLVRVVGEAGDGLEAMTQIDLLHPDAVLMDVRMPLQDGLVTAEAIKARWPGVRVVLLSLYANYEQAALEAGAAAFVVKGAPVDQLLTALLG